jgi:hypothetical protein
VKGGPRQGEVGVAQHRVVVQALDPPSGPIRRERRDGMKRPRQHGAQRPGIRVRGQDAECGVPGSRRGQPRRQHPGPTSHSVLAFLPSEPLTEDVADDGAATASDAERGEVRRDRVGAIAIEDGEAGRLLEETRFEQGLAPLGRQVLQR